MTKYFLGEREKRERFHETSKKNMNLEVDFTEFFRFSEKRKKPDITSTFPLLKQKKVQCDSTQFFMKQNILLEISRYLLQGDEYVPF